jgi:hypothetical protein
VTTHTRTRTAIAAIVAVAALALAGCDSATPSKSAQRSTQQQTEDAFAQQQAAVPYPADQLKDSLERRNIKERLLRTNQPNKIGYVYLLSFSGQPLGYYVIKGKVSSTDSQMTTTDLIVTNCHTSGPCNDVTVPAPGDDGSYGPNEGGIFFFTTENAMVTTNLNYLYSDAPLPLDAPKLNGK